MSFTLNIIDDEILLDGDVIIPQVNRPTSQYKRCYKNINTHLFDPQTSKIHARVRSICYSVTREKAPIYVMGPVDPERFTKSKRGISGKMIITWFSEEMSEHDPVIGMPQDIVITLTNEYGQLASIRMIGIELLTLDGTVMDKYVPGIYTFTARGLRAIQPVIT